MENRQKIVDTLRRSSAATSYGELREASGVPVGSFDRVLGAPLDDGTIAKGDGGYRLGDGTGDGTPTATPGQESNADRYRGMLAYCAECGASHPKPPRGESPNFEDFHRLGITA